MGEHDSASAQAQQPHQPWKALRQSPDSFSRAPSNAMAMAMGRSRFSWRRRSTAHRDGVAKNGMLHNARALSEKGKSGHSAPQVNQSSQKRERGRRGRLWLLAQSLAPNVSLRAPRMYAHAARARAAAWMAEHAPLTSQPHRALGGWVGGSSGLSGRWVRQSVGRFVGRARQTSAQRWPIVAHYSPKAARIWPRSGQSWSDSADVSSAPSQRIRPMVESRREVVREIGQQQTQLGRVGPKLVHIGRETHAQSKAALHLSVFPEKHGRRDSSMDIRRALNAAENANANDPLPLPHVAVRGRRLAYDHAPHLQMGGGAVDGRRHTTIQRGHCGHVVAMERPRRPIPRGRNFPHREHRHSMARHMVAVDHQGGTHLWRCRGAAEAGPRSPHFREETVGQPDAKYSARRKPHLARRGP